LERARRLCAAYYQPTLGADRAGLAGGGDLATPCGWRALSIPQAAAVDAACSPPHVPPHVCLNAAQGASLVYFDGRLAEAAVLLARGARAAGEGPRAGRPPAMACTQPGAACNVPKGGEQHAALVGLQGGGWRPHWPVCPPCQGLQDLVREV